MVSPDSFDPDEHPKSKLYPMSEWGREPIDDYPTERMYRYTAAAVYTGAHFRYMLRLWLLRCRRCCDGD